MLNNVSQIVKESQFTFVHVFLYIAKPYHAPQKSKYDGYNIHVGALADETTPSEKDNPQTKHYLKSIHTLYNLIKLLFFKSLCKIKHNI